MELNASKGEENEKGGLPQGLVFKGPEHPPLQSLNVGTLLDIQHERFPKKVALVSRWQDTSLSYSDLRNSSRKIAQILLASGVRPGDRVIVLSGNSIEYSQLFFAVGGIGAIFAIINPTFTENEAIAAIQFLSKYRDSETFIHC